MDKNLCGMKPDSFDHHINLSAQEENMTRDIDLFFNCSRSMMDVLDRLEAPLRAESGRAKFLQQVLLEHKNHIKKLEADLSHGRKRILEIENSNQHLREKQLDLHNQIHQFEAEKNRLIAEYARMEQELQNERLHSAQLRERLSNLEFNLSETQRKQLEAATQAQLLQNELDKNKALLETERFHSQQWQSKIDQLHQQLQQITQTHQTRENEYRQQLESAFGKASSHQQNAERFSHLLENEKTRTQELEFQVQSLEEQLLIANKTHENELAEICLQREAFLSQLNSKKQQMDKLQLQLEIEQKNVADWNLKYKELQAQLANQTATHQDHDRQNRQALDEALERVRIHSSETEKIKISLEQMQNQKIELQQRITSLDQELKELKAQLAEAREMSDLYEQESKKSAELSQAYQLKIESLEREMTQKEKISQQILEQSLKENRAKEETLKSEISNREKILKLQLEKEREKFTAVEQEQSKNIQGQKERIRQLEETLTQESSRLDQSLDQSKDQIQKLEKTIGDLRAENNKDRSRLETELSKERKIVSELERKSTQLTEALKLEQYRLKQFQEGDQKKGKELQQIHNEIYKDRVRYESVIQSDRKALAELQTKFERLQENAHLEIQRLREENAHFKATAQRLLREKEELDKRMAAMMHDQDHLRSHLEKAKDAINRELITKNGLMDELVTVENALEEAHTEIRRMTQMMSIKPQQTRMPAGTQMNSNIHPKINQ